MSLQQSNILLLIYLEGEFKVTKQCTSMISEVQDVEQSKVLKLKQNLLICLCFVSEFIGEECLLGEQTRQFSVISNSLDSQVYRISKYDIESIFSNLTVKGQENYFNLIEALIQKREWRLERFNELHLQFSKEKKMMQQNTINSLRQQKSDSQTPRSKLTSNGASPNNLKLQALQNQYHAKLNFSSVLQNGDIYLMNEDEIEEKDSQNKKLKSKINSADNIRSRQGSMIPQDQQSSSSSLSNTSIDNQLIKQESAKIDSNYSNDNKYDLDQSKLNTSSKQFDPDNYYEKLQQKLKKSNDLKEIQTKSVQKLLDHNKMLNFDYSKQKQQKNLNIQESPKFNITQIKNNVFSPLNASMRSQIQSKNSMNLASQTSRFNNTPQSPQLQKAHSEKMKLHENDERALQDYYKLKNLPISVMFSKADEQLQKKISSNTNQMSSRLINLGIETPKQKQNQSQSSELVSLRYQIVKNTSETQSQFKRTASTFNANTTPISQQSNRKLRYQFSQGRILTPQNSSTTRNQVDQSTYIQMIRDRNRSAATIIVNNNISNNKSQQLVQNEENVQTPQKLKKQQSSKDTSQEKLDYVNQQKKQKEEYEEYLKEKQFIKTMNNYANMYKIVEMNYLEQHSLKAHQLMKDSMDDMNLIKKFSQQTYTRKKQESSLEVKKKEYVEKLQKKQKLQQFEKKRQDGIINSSEVNIDNSFELNKHLKNLAFQGEIFDDINDPTGSKAKNYNFGGTKQKRKVGIQLNQITELSKNLNKQPNNLRINDNTEELNSKLHDSKIIEKEQTQRNQSFQIVDNKQPENKFIQQKTLDVLAQMQKNYIQSLEKPTQKQLEINQLRNKFQKNAQLRVFKQQKSDSNTQHPQISEILFERNQEDENTHKISNSIDSINVPRGCNRKSNSQYFYKLLFGITQNNNEIKLENKNSNSQITQQQTINFSNQTNYNGSITQKPYQHINNVKSNDFVQSVWDTSKKQLQFKRILNYNN